MFEDDITEVSISARDGRVYVKTDAFEFDMTASDAFGFGRLMYQVAGDEMRKNMPEDGIFKV